MTTETVVTSMPIDIETFSEATDEDLQEVTNAEKVVQFLYRNNDQAFTPAEIADGTGVKKTSISTVLRRLEERKLVKHKGDYWAIGDEEIVHDAFQFHRSMDALNEQFGAEDLEAWKTHAPNEPNE